MNAQCMGSRERGDLGGRRSRRPGRSGRWDDSPTPEAQTYRADAKPEIMSWESARNQARAFILGGRSRRDDGRDGKEMEARAEKALEPSGSTGRTRKASDAAFTVGPTVRAVGRLASSHGDESTQGFESNTPSLERPSVAGFGLSRGEDSLFLQQQEAARHFEHLQTSA